MAWCTFSGLERLVDWERKVRFFILDAILLSEKADTGKANEAYTSALDFTSEVTKALNSMINLSHGDQNRFFGKSVLATPVSIHQTSQPRDRNAGREPKANPHRSSSYGQEFLTRSR